MKRTVKTEKRKEIYYPSQDEPIILSKALLDIVLAQKDAANILALYCFYYYTAKWQKTHQIKATTKYTANGINWGIEKVRRIKSKLKSLGLIEDVTVKNASNRITGHFIRVRLIFHPSGFASGGEIEPKCFNTNNINPPIEEEKTKKITPTQFDKFWYLYPRKVDKGKAYTKWMEICRKKSDDPNRPEWKVVKEAIAKQKRSLRWQNKKYIPHPTTWLNQHRWLDNPMEMKSFDDHSKPAMIIRHGVKYFLKKDDTYVSKKGDILND